MKNQKIINLLDKSDTDSKHFATKKVVVPLKHLSNFFRSLEMPLINCKIKLNLTWKKECVLSTGAGEAVFIINDTKLYVPVVTLSKEDNKDFIEQKKEDFRDLFIVTNLKQKK